MCAEHPIRHGYSSATLTGSHGDRSELRNLEKLHELRWTASKEAADHLAQSVEELRAAAASATDCAALMDQRLQLIESQVRPLALQARRCRAHDQNARGDQLAWLLPRQPSPSILQLVLLLAQATLRRRSRKRIR